MQGGFIHRQISMCDVLGNPTLVGTSNQNFTIVYKTSERSNTYD